ncbi:MAG: hypothetical protein MK008_06635 [Bdellovibrionales bacterium]|nr:hypothetical protein [Bdellovibrionales bacterium]
MYSKEALGGFLSTYNKHIWPTQLVWVFVSIVIFYILVMKNQLTKLVLIFFSAAWFFTGWYFYKDHFSSINLASHYAFYLCAAQGAIILGFALLPSIRLNKNLLALSVLFVCFFVPFEWIFKDELLEVTLFGWGPLPVSIASLALIGLIIGLKIKLLLLSIIPSLILCFALASHFYAQ